MKSKIFVFTNAICHQKHDLFSYTHKSNISSFFYHCWSLQYPKQWFRSRKYLEMHTVFMFILYYSKIGRQMALRRTCKRTWELSNSFLCWESYREIDFRIINIIYTELQICVVGTTKASCLSILIKKHWEFYTLLSYYKSKLPVRCLMLQLIDYTYMNARGVYVFSFPRDFDVAETQEAPKAVLIKTEYNTIPT